MDLEDHIRDATAAQREHQKALRENTLRLLETGAETSGVLVSELLQPRQLLQQLCGNQLDWVALPDIYPTLQTVVTAKHVVEKARETPYAAGEDSWFDRHRGLLSAPKNAKVGAVRYSPCRLGICMCKPGFHKAALARVAAFLRLHDQTQLVQGDLVLTFSGYLLEPRPLGGNKKQSTSLHQAIDVGTPGHGQLVTELHAHVSSCCLRPFRPVLMQLLEISRDGDHITFVPAEDFGKPVLQNIYEWLFHTLNPTFAWDVCSRALSQRHTAIARIHQGEARCDDVVLAEPRRIWKAHWEMVRTRQAQPPAHERLLVAEDNRADIQQHDERARGASGDDDVFPELFGDSDVEEVLEEEKEEEADPLSELAAFAETQLQDEMGNRPMESSSSSDSDTTTTTSHADSDGHAPDAGPAHSPEPAATPRREAGRAVQPATHSWGPFRITFRPATGGKAPQWQATCRYHAQYTASGRIQTQCTRSRTLEGGDVNSAANLRVLRMLKDWLLQGEGIADKSAHQRLVIREEKGDETLNQELSELLPVPDEPRGGTPDRRAAAADARSDSEPAPARPKRQRRS